MKSKADLKAELAALLAQVRPGKRPRGDALAVVLSGARANSLDALVAAVAWEFHHPKGEPRFAPLLARIVTLAVALDDTTAIARIAEAAKRFSDRREGWGEDFRFKSEKAGAEAVRWRWRWAGHRPIGARLSDLRRVYLAAETKAEKRKKGKPSVSDRTLLRLAAENDIIVLREKRGRPSVKK